MTTTQSNRGAWGKNKSLISVVGLLRDDRIPAHYFSDEWVEVCSDGGSGPVHHKVIYHWGNRHERPWCVDAEWVGKMEDFTTSFDALAGMDLCEACWTGKGLDNVLASNPGGWRDGSFAVLATLWRIWDLKRQIRTHEARLGGEGTTPSPRPTSRLLAQAESSAAYALALVQRNHSDLADYAASLQEAAAGLRKASAGSSAQKQVLCEQVKELVTPTWWEGEPRALDDSEAVLVMYPVPRLTGRFNVARQALRVFAVAGDGGRGARKVVVAGPRYMMDYLARLSGDPSETYCVVSDALPGEVLETAAALWEPANGGALCDWAVAVETAERLLVGN